MEFSDLPICVGIAGSSCSGKSTLQSNLHKRFGGETVALLSFDDFFKGTEALDDGGADIESWETPDLFREEEYGQAVADLRAGYPVRFAARSYESRQAEITERIVQPRPLVVAAGFLALRPPAVESFDIKIFIDLPPAEMVRRRLARAVLRGTTWWETEDYMWQALVPDDRKFVQPQRLAANYCVDGMQPPEEIETEVISIILRHW